MKKATPQPPATNTATEADINALATYFTQASDHASAQLRERVGRIVSNIEDSEHRIRSRESDIQALRDIIADYEREQVTLSEQIEALPVVEPVLPEFARADVERILALPYVKRVDFVERDGAPCIVVQTRPNALYTTLTKKYSRSGRWYGAKPYRIALPAYNIRVALQPQRTLSNYAGALGLALADAEEDTAYFLNWTNYSHEPHPHWGTVSVGRDDRGDYRGVCLGEYESEVTQAFKRSIAEGVVALAVYLQIAGTRSAYVNDRAYWALWLGKKEYNLAMVPSEKEIPELVPGEEGTPGQEDEEPDEIASCNAGSDCDDCEDEECDCDCHNG